MQLPTQPASFLYSRVTHSWSSDSLLSTLFGPRAMSKGTSTSPFMYGRPYCLPEWPCGPSEWPYCALPSDPQMLLQHKTSGQNLSAWHHVAAVRCEFSSLLSAVSYFQMKSIVLSGIKHTHWWKGYVSTTEISILWRNVTIHYQSSILTEPFHLRRAN